MKAFTLLTDAERGVAVCCLVPPSWSGSCVPCWSWVEDTKQDLVGKPAGESDAAGRGRVRYRVRSCVRSPGQMDERKWAVWPAHIVSLSIQVYTHTSAA